MKRISEPLPCGPEEGRALHRRRSNGDGVLVLLLGAVVGCNCPSSATSGDAVIVATIEIDPGVTADCVELVISNPAGGTGAGSLDDLRFALAAGQSQLVVGIYQQSAQQKLPDVIQLVANALQGGTSCDNGSIVATSGPVPRQFPAEGTTTVTLQIMCVSGGSCGNLDGGTTDAGVADSGGDSGTSDSGATDSGSPDSGVGAIDAGTDSGALDSGVFDSGLTDSGAIDSGPIDAGAGDSGPMIQAFLYQPSNFDPTAIPNTEISGAITLNCGNSEFDSTGTGTFNNWCGPPPNPIIQFQNGDAGPEVAILPMSQFVIGDAGTLTLLGDKPVILAVYGSATILGPITAGAQGGNGGPGGGLLGYCAGSGSEGADGGPNTAGSTAGGGGGGGFGAGGANGGDGNMAGGTHGNGGSPIPNPLAHSLSPLQGGCSGGNGGTSLGGPSGTGGGGGGGLQLSAASQLEVASRAFVAASGGGGAGGQAMGGVGASGAGGGGSGGGILLEAEAMTIEGWVTANGGGGGEGGHNNGMTGVTGSTGSSSSNTPAPGGSSVNSSSGPGGSGQTSAMGSIKPGGPGNNGNGAGGGGGGAVGIIILNAYSSCSITGANFSPAYAKNGGKKCP
jgi:hypothetical protein